jgi:PAS domain S-box-containing protein
MDYLHKEYTDKVQSDNQIAEFLQNTAVDGLWYWDLKQQENAWINDQFFEAIGLTAEVFAGMENNWLDLIFPQDLKKVLKLIHHLVAEGEFIFDRTVRYFHHNGEIVWMRCRGLIFCDEQGKASRMVGAHINVTSEKVNEINLAQKIKRFNQIIEGTGLATWEWNIEKGSLLLNDNWKKLLGYEPHELKNATIDWWTGHIHPEDLAIIRSLLLAHFKGEIEKFELDMRLRQKDGTWIFTTCKGKVIKRIRGRATLMTGYHEDLSAIKKSEAELLHYQDLLERTNKVAKIGTWEVDIIKNEMYWSKETKQIHEVDENFVPKITGGIQFYKEGVNRDRITSVFNLASSEGKSFDEELQIITQKGNLKWIRTVGVPQFLNNKLVKVYGVFQDITERKFQEEALQASYNQTKLFIEQAPSAIAMFDKQVNYLAASKQWIKDYQLDDKNLIGQSHYTLFPEIGEDWRKIHQEGLKGKVIRTDEAEFKRADGSSQWITWEVRPWYNAANQIGGLLMYTADVTPLIKARKEAKLLLDVMTEQNERLLNFSHIVSHNLRSHTSNLSMLIDLMEKEPMQDTQESYFPMFKKATENLAETIRHLNEVANMNRQSNEQMKRLNLREYIQKNISSLEASFLEAGAEVAIEASAEATVYAIPAYLDSILLNLMTNAIKYRSPERQLKLAIRVYEEGDKVVICFEDNGLGIDLKRHRHKVFGMYKVFHTHKDARGVGLFITKSQIEAMNGKIEIESEPNVGTKFNIYLDR